MNSIQDFDKKVLNIEEKSEKWTRKSMAEKIEILTKKNRHLRSEKLIESKEKNNNGLSEKKKDALNRAQS